MKFDSKNPKIKSKKILTKKRVLKLCFLLLFLNMSWFGCLIYKLYSKQHMKQQKKNGSIISYFLHLASLEMQIKAYFYSQ